MSDLQMHNLIFGDNGTYAVRPCPEYPAQRIFCVTAPEGHSATVYAPQHSKPWQAVPQHGAATSLDYHPQTMIDAAKQWEQQWYEREALAA